MRSPEVAGNAQLPQPGLSRNVGDQEEKAYKGEEGTKEGKERKETETKNTDSQPFRKDLFDLTEGGSGPVYGWTAETS